MNQTRLRLGLALLVPAALLVVVLVASGDPLLAIFRMSLIAGVLHLLPVLIFLVPGLILIATSRSR
jgi:hypothetical protein